MYSIILFTLESMWFSLHSFNCIFQITIIENAWFWYWIYNIKLIFLENKQNFILLFIVLLLYEKIHIDLVAWSLIFIYLWLLLFYYLRKDVQSWLCTSGSSNIDSPYGGCDVASCGISTYSLLLSTTLGLLERNHLFHNNLQPQFDEYQEKSPQP